MMNVSCPRCFVRVASQVDTDCKDEMMCKLAVDMNLPDFVMKMLGDTKALHFCAPGAGGSTRPPASGPGGSTRPPATANTRPFTKPNGGEGGTFGKCKSDEECKGTHKCLQAPKVGAFQIPGVCMPAKCKVRVPTPALLPFFLRVGLPLHCWAALRTCWKRRGSDGRIN